VTVHRALPNAPASRALLLMVVSSLCLAIGAATPGCASNPAPVPVDASRADWEILAGQWEGTYSTTPQGRTGTIDFRLSAQAEQAAGDVLMIAENEKVPYGRFPPGDARVGPTNTRDTHLLTIRFVRAQQGHISGTIDSYWDPDRRCQATAVFLGQVKDRVIDGTFTSTCDDGVRRLNGKWRVTRQATTR
jgi:hypothetical protein